MTKMRFFRRFTALRTFSHWSSVFMVTVAVSLPLVANAQQQTYRQADIDNGALLYNAQCSSCHGVGNGVTGIDLRTGAFRHARSDNDLLAIIRNGIPGTAMPAHGDLAGHDILSLVAYIRNMRDYNVEAVKLGDAQKGKALFEGKGDCLSCHRVNGKGSQIALDLSDTGALHPAAYLERALLDPKTNAEAQPQNRFVQAVTKTGRIVKGRRLNEDTFTIQLMDDHENLVSLEKANLKSLTIVEGAAMPSAKGILTEEQIMDLVAYLASLRVPGQETQRLLTETSTH